MEVIGTYDPIPKADPYDSSGKLHKDIKLDMVRARYWIGVGAQPSDPVWRILSMVGGGVPSVQLSTRGRPGPTVVQGAIRIAESAVSTGSSER